MVLLVVHGRLRMVVRLCMWRRPVRRFGRVAALKRLWLWRLVAPVLLQGTGIGRWRLWWTRDSRLLQSSLLFIGRCLVVVVVRRRTDRRILLGGRLSLGLLLLLLRHGVLGGHSLVLARLRLDWTHARRAALQCISSCMVRGCLWVAIPVMRLRLGIFL